MNILYISGMARTIDSEGNKIPYEKDIEKEFIFQKYGDKLIYPEVFWDRGDYMAKYLEDLINKYDVGGLIGYSAGGYLSFYFSNKYKIPAMLINPAIAENCMAPKLQTIDDSFKNAPVNNDQIIIIGEKDTKAAGGVDYQLSLKFLDEVGFKGEIFKEPDMRHSISYEMLENYFEYFHENYLK